jgi:hypothetical protein
VAMSLSTRVCRKCSREFVRKEKGQSTKYCRPCLTTRDCEWCGISIVHKPHGQNTCGLSCASNLNTKRRGLTHRTTTFTCVGCNKEITRPVRKHKDAGKYCSRECSFAKLTIQRAQDKTARLVALRQKRISAKRVRLEVAALIRIGKRQRLNLQPKLIAAPRLCSTCGISLVGYSKQSKLCADCLRASSRKSRNATRTRRRRLGFDTRKHKDRAAKYGCEYDRTLSTIAIFDRDGWKCQACGVDTPRHLKGSYDPSAPELDHIIPMSKQGPHIASNVQCLCRSCNSFKGAQIIPPTSRGDIKGSRLFNT